MILQSTPVLFVETIAPSEEFFARLGFDRTVSVPEDGTPHFVILSAGGVGGNDGVGIMLQTYLAAEDDVTELPPEAFRQHSHLFMAVADLDAAEKLLAGHAVFMPRRDTFYGATEIGWREPGGHYITLAQFAANTPDEA